MKCRFCQTPLTDVFLDLVSAPPSNAFLTAAQLTASEAYFALKLFTCPDCHLVQVDEVQKHDEIFSSDYVYFSSFSKSWLAHAERYVATITERLALNASSLVMEVAANDGYLLQYFKARSIPCVGVEPTASTAKVCREKGIETLEQFFGAGFVRDFVARRGCCDLVLGNNVLAHVPDINDFVAGLRLMLKPEGVVTMEFPHLMQLVAHNQFDTVYHEHFSYFSFHTVSRIFAAQGLRMWDVEELPTHGGSLRIWACLESASRAQSTRVASLLAREKAAGMLDFSYYRGFQAKADVVKNDFLRFLLTQKQAGKTVVGYGAAAKGNTLMNYAGVKPDLVSYVVDASPHKQGRYLPGSHIPVLAPDVIRETRPDFIVIFPWNLREEIMQQLTGIRDWGGQFVTAVPQLAIT